MKQKKIIINENEIELTLKFKTVLIETPEYYELIIPDLAKAKKFILE